MIQPPHFYCPVKCCGILATPKHSDHKTFPQGNYMYELTSILVIVFYHHRVQNYVVCCMYM